jgi:uncharacterized membrane protein YedE/YeeE
MPTVLIRYVAKTNNAFTGESMPPMIISTNIKAHIIQLFCHMVIAPTMLTHAVYDVHPTLSIINWPQVNLQSNLIILGEDLYNLMMRL